MEKITSLAESFEYIIGIDLETNQPIGHPYAIWNFREVYPEIDLQNLPDQWAFFRRKNIPESFLTKDAETVLKMPVSNYGWNNGAIEDVWTLGDMGEIEKTELFVTLDRDHRRNMQMINNNLALLKVWATRNTTYFLNGDEWQAWLDSLPAQVTLPPERRAV